VRVAIIPARGGSVRIPRKNIKPFFGKPIIAYSIATAKRTGLFDRVVVSTDDDEIAAVARSCGAESLMRGPGLADVGTQRIGEDALERLAGDGPIATHACVIYATCPLMLPRDLEAGWEALRDRRALFAFAVGAEPLRDAGMFYWGEGWAFAARKELISPRTAMVPIPEERVCDINTPDDWRRAEIMFAAHRADAACAAS
jgi:pseudaminic acid cytidylyltransferase